MGLENWRSRESGKLCCTAGSWRPTCDVENVGMDKSNDDKLRNDVISEYPNFPRHFSPLITIPKFLNVSIYPPKR